MTFQAQCDLSQPHPSLSSSLTSFPSLLPLAQSLQMLSCSLLIFPWSGPAACLPGRYQWPDALPQAKVSSLTLSDVCSDLPSWGHLDLFRMEAPSSPEALAPFCFIFPHRAHHYTGLYGGIHGIDFTAHSFYWLSSSRMLKCSSSEDTVAFVLLPEASSVLIPCITRSALMGCLLDKWVNEWTLRNWYDLD